MYALTTFFIWNIGFTIELFFSLYFLLGHTRYDKRVWTRLLAMLIENKFQLKIVRVVFIEEDGSVMFAVGIMMFFSLKILQKLIYLK